MKVYYFLNQVCCFLEPHFACEHTELWDKGLPYLVGRVHCSCFLSDVHRRLSDLANCPNALRGWFGVFFQYQNQKAPACINVFYKSQLLESTTFDFVVCFRDILVMCFCN